MEEISSATRVPKNEIEKNNEVVCDYCKHKQLNGKQTLQCLIYKVVIIGQIGSDVNVFKRKAIFD